MNGNSSILLLLILHFAVTDLVMEMTYIFDNRKERHVQNYYLKEKGAFEQLAFDQSLSKTIVDKYKILNNKT